MRRIATPRFYIRQSSASGDVPKQPLRDQYDTAWGSGGKISADTVSRRDRIRAVTPCRCTCYAIKEKGRRPPGGFRFLSPRRKEQRDSIIRHGEVHNSILIFFSYPLSPSPATRELPPGGSSGAHPCDWSVPPAGDSYRWLRRHLPQGGRLCTRLCGWPVPPAGDSYRHPLTRMPPPSRREALCTRVAMQPNIKKRAHDGRACCMLP